MGLVGQQGHNELGAIRRRRVKPGLADRQLGDRRHRHRDNPQLAIGEVQGRGGRVIGADNGERGARLALDLLPADADAQPQPCLWRR